jgi:hypothetical protein
MRFAKYFAKQEGRFTLFAVFQRAVEGTEGHRGNRGLQSGQRIIERIEGRRG